MSPRHHFAERFKNQNKRRYHSPMFFETAEYRIEAKVEKFFDDLLKKLMFWKKS